MHRGANWLLDIYYTMWYSYCIWVMFHPYIPFLHNPGPICVILFIASFLLIQCLHYLGPLHLFHVSLRSIPVFITLIPWVSFLYHLAPSVTIPSYSAPLHTFFYNRAPLYTFLHILSPLHTSLHILGPMLYHSFIA